MSLDASLAIADSGLSAVNRALSVVGQNIANAGTPGWTAEQPVQESVTAGGSGEGVITLPTQRQLDSWLQGSVFTQNSDVAGLQTQQNALAGINQVQGTVGAGTDLASLVGKLQDAFSTLEVDPSVDAQQQAVVADAGSVAQQINSVAYAVAQARQQAQDSAVSGVATLNAALAQVTTLNQQIVGLQAQGYSIADLQNQRDAVVGQISQLVPVKQVALADGSVTLITSTGLTLPTLPNSRGFSLAAAGLAPSLTFPASPAVPALLLDGIDVTRQLGSSGQIGANLTLRDSTLPALQAGLDQFAFTLADRFDQQGLTLFTDNLGTLPTAAGPHTQSGYIGFANTISVNPAVVAQPSLVRDGTHDVAGSAGGASAFTVNPVGGPSGFTGLIQRVLDFTFSGQAQPGVAQPTPAGTGLGPAGDQNAGFQPPADLGSFASALVASQSQTASTAASGLTSAQAVQTGLQTRLSSGSGVSIDTEMSHLVELQNAYGANAKVLTAVEAMWTALLQSVA